MGRQDSKSLEPSSRRVHTKKRSGQKSGPDCQRNKRARECERRSQTGTKKNRWQEARGKCAFKVSPEDTDHPKVFSDAREKSQHGYSGTRAAIAQNGGGTTTSKQMDHKAEKDMCLSSITARHTNLSLTKKRCKFSKTLGTKRKDKKTR